jgi:hypothetical protein
VRSKEFTLKVQSALRTGKRLLIVDAAGGPALEDLRHELRGVPCREFDLTQVHNERELNKVLEPLRGPADASQTTATEALILFGLEGIAAGGGAEQRGCMGRLRGVMQCVPNRRVFYVAAGVDEPWLWEHWASPKAPFNRQFEMVKLHSDLAKKVKRAIATRRTAASASSALHKKTTVNKPRGETFGRRFSRLSGIGKRLPADASRKEAYED